MFKVRLSNVICAIKSGLLPPQYSRLEDGSWKGLVISADLSMEDFGVGRGRRSSVHFAFTKNTSVWFSCSDRLWRWNDIPIEEWRNTSNHDSCWRTDGVESVLTQLYFEWTRKINPNKAPKDISKFCTMGVMLCSPWEYVLVECENDPNESYWQVLKSIRKADAHE